MLAAIKGLSRHKRFPPTSGKESVGQDDKGRISAGRGAPHLFHDPLDRRCAWRCSEGCRDGERLSGGTVRRAPAGGVEQGT